MGVLLGGGEIQADVESQPLFERIASRHHYPQYPTWRGTAFGRDRLPLGGPPQDYPPQHGGDASDLFGYGFEGFPDSSSWPFDGSGIVEAPTSTVDGRPPAYGWAIAELEAMPADFPLFGEKAPSWDQIESNGKGPRWNLHEKGKRKLHVKDVGSVNLKELMNLPMSANCRSALEKLLPWLSSDEHYAKVEFDGKFFPCHLAREHIPILARSCKVERVTEEMLAEFPTAGACHVFSVTEDKDLPPPDDKRERPIGHPIHNNNWVCRDVASLFSLLFYASNTLDLSPARFFNAMRYYRRLSQELQARPYLWMANAPEVPEYVRLQLEEWVGSVLINPWRPMTKPAPPQKWLITDASAWGWGAICWDGRTVITHQEPWESTYLRTEKSAHTEPEALIRALRRFVRPGEPATLYTDHEALKYAVPKGYSPSFIVNGILFKVRAEFGKEVKIVYVPGKWNPADYLSRNRDQAEIDVLLTKAFIEASTMHEENGSINPEPFQGLVAN